MINVFQPCVGPAELEAVREAFESNWLGAGPRVAEFERQFAKLIDVPSDEVVSTSCCTEGLFQALAALELRPDDEVVIPTISFIGAAHAVRASGARIVLCDVDAQTLNPTVDDVARVLTQRTKAIVILHFGGRAGKAAEIAELASSRSLVLIEDAACAVGSSAKDQACGTFGDIGVWSFDAMKTLVTGDGGIVRAKAAEILDKIRLRTRLGIEATGHSRAAEGCKWWQVEPTEVGRRCYMNDIAAAIGLAQLKRLPSLLQRRAQIAAAYDVALSAIDWLRLPPPPQPGTAHYFYWIQLGDGDRDALAEHLLGDGIYTTFRYWPLHRTALYRSRASFPGADAAADSTLLLPLHPGLSDVDISTVIASLRKFEPRRQ